MYLGFVASLAPGVTLQVKAPGAPEIYFKSDLPSIIPGGVAGILGIALNVLLVMLILNQVQLMLLSSSLLFLALFTVMGLILRTFGFTRTFGGAMIALGLGLGLVYPLLVSVTYGFITPHIAQASLANDFANGLGLLYAFIFGSLSSGSADFLARLGYVIMGLTFVPFLNFIILDAFIVDFSKSVGERIDFMSMMTGMI